MPPPEKRRKKSHARAKSSGGSGGDGRAWEALDPPLTEWVLRAVTEGMGLEKMTPVQASVIPLAMGNKDVVCEAVTGSGKTLAFLIPIIEKLLRREEPVPKHHIGAVIISPTRELATQIYTVTTTLLSYQPTPSSPDASTTTTNTITPLLLTPSPHRSQTPHQTLSHFLTSDPPPNLLIATPGRLLDLLSSPFVHAPQSSFETLVLDEADRLLDMGFSDDLGRILARLPKMRRTGLFSASVGEGVESLVRCGVRNPVKVVVRVKGGDDDNGDGGERGDGRTPASLHLTHLTVPPPAKLPTLLSLISSLDPIPLRTIAYLPTCACVDYFSNLLPVLIPHFFHPQPNTSTSTTTTTSNTLKILPLHRLLPPSTRSRNLSLFCNPPSSSNTAHPTPHLLLTTDLAARGLDIPHLPLSIQLDPPTNPTTYIHRAGRTARAGRPGLSVLFLTPGRETDQYPAFLRARGTPSTPLEQRNRDGTPLPPSDTETSRATALLRRHVRTDRALHDLAQRALPSYVRACTQRQRHSPSIFRVHEIPWRQLWEQFALLRVPRMPELRRLPEGEVNGLDLDLGLDLRDLGLGCDEVDWRTYAYRDPKRERERLDGLKPDGDGTGTAKGREEKKGDDGSGGGSKEATREKEREREREGGAWSSRKSQQREKQARRERKGKARERRRREGLSAEEREREDEVDALITRVKRGG